jgi:hypothetical protein
LFGGSGSGRSTFVRRISLVTDELTTRTMDTAYIPYIRHFTLISFRSLLSWYDRTYNSRYHGEPWSNRYDYDRLLAIANSIVLPPLLNSSSPSSTATTTLSPMLPCKDDISYVATWWSGEMDTQMSDNNVGQYRSWLISQGIRHPMLHESCMPKGVRRQWRNQVLTACQPVPYPLTDGSDHFMCRFHHVSAAIAISVFSLRLPSNYINRVHQ